MLRNSDIQCIIAFDTFIFRQTDRLFRQSCKITLTKCERKKKNCKKKKKILVHLFLMVQCLFPFVSFQKLQTPRGQHSLAWTVGRRSKKIVFITKRLNFLSTHIVLAFEQKIVTPHWTGFTHKGLAIR